MTETSIPKIKGQGAILMIEIKGTTTDDTEVIRMKKKEILSVKDNKLIHVVETIDRIIRGIEVDQEFGKSALQVNTADVVQDQKLM